MSFHPPGRRERALGSADRHDPATDLEQEEAHIERRVRQWDRVAGVTAAVILLLLVARVAIPLAGPAFWIPMVAACTLLLLAGAAILAIASRWPS